MSEEEEAKEPRELFEVRKDLAEVKLALAEVKSMLAMLIEYLGLPNEQQGPDELADSPIYWSVYYCCSWQELMRAMHCVMKAWRFKFDSNFGALAAEPVSLEKLTFPSTPTKHWQVLRFALPKSCLPYNVAFMGAMKALIKAVAEEASVKVTTTWADSGLIAAEDKNREHIEPWSSCEMNELELLFEQEASSDDAQDKI